MEILKLLEKAESRKEIEEKHFSVSRVNTCRRCFRQFYYSYWLGIKQPSNAAREFGSSVGIALEEGYKEIMRDGKSSTGYILDIFHEAWRTKIELIDWIKEDEDAMVLANIGEEILRLHTKTIMPTQEPLAVEERVEYRDKETGLWIGYIDLREEKKITDHKTSKRKFADSKHPLNSSQLAFYSLCAGINSVGFDVMVKKAKPEIQRLRYSFKEREKNVHFNGMKAIAKQIDMIWEEAKRLEELDESPSLIWPSCDPSSWVCSEKYCGYWEMCRKDLSKGIK